MIATRAPNTPSSRALDASMLRSCLSVVLAIFQPSPRWPTRLLWGTRTSVKKTSLNSDWPVIVLRGRISMPGVSIGISR